MEIKPDIKPYSNKHPGSSSKVLPGVNLALLAKKSGISRSHLSRIVNGVSRPGLVALAGLRDALKLKSVEQVVEWLRLVVAVKGNGSS